MPRKNRTYPLGNIEDAMNGGAEVSPDGYSGRNMYGRTCASIVFDTETDAFQFFAQLGAYTADRMDPAGRDEEFQIVRELVGCALTDSMGLGIIVYFPGWVFA